MASKKETAFITKMAKGTPKQKAFAKRMEKKTTTTPKATVKKATAKKVNYSPKEARAGKDIGKKGKMFAQIAKKAAKEYGSKKAGQKVAGAILAKLRGKRK